MARTEIQITLRGRSIGLSKDGWLVINNPNKTQIVVSPTGLLYTDAAGSTITLGGLTTGLNIFVGNQSVTPVVLTDAATVATNVALSNNFYLTLLASGHAMGAPTNPTDGMVCNWTVNSGAGSFTFTWNAAFDFGGAGAPVHSTSASKEDLVSAIYSAATSKWLANFRKGS